MAIGWCPICEENIYPHEMYTFFAEDYSHTACADFVRLQARMMRGDNGV